MNRLQRLAPILELAENNEKQAVQALGESQRKLDAAREGVNSLNSFRESYAARFYQAGAQGLAIHQLHEFRAFLGKINIAVVDQEKLALQAEKELQACRQAWEEAHRRTLGMRKLVDNLRLEETKLAQKRERNELDDRASRCGNGGKTLWNTSS